MSPHSAPDPGSTASPQLRRRILLTGGTGLIGGELLHRLLEWTRDVEVVVAVRAPSAAHAAHRVRNLMAGLYGGREVPDEVSRRVMPLQVDLARPGLGFEAAEADALRAGLTDIVHSAAAVRMDLPLESLRATNVDATRHLLDFAREVPRLTRFHHVSTIGVAGRLSGLLAEEPLLPTEFNNAYEQSKWEAERLVLARSGELPISVHRLSQIFGDSRTGWTPHFRMSYMFARLVLSGVLPCLPLREGAMTDAVTADYAADALFALLLGHQPISGAIFHEVAGHRAMPIRDWAEALVMRATPVLRAHGLPLPSIELVPQEQFERWRAQAGVSDPGHGALLRQIEGLLPHMSMAPRIFDDRRTLAALAASGVVKRLPYENTAIDAYPIRSNWGLKPEPRPPLGNPVRVHVSNEAAVRDSA